MTAVAWFEIVVGVAIAGIWTVLVTTRQVPEIRESRRDIWFHLAAELLTAVVLVSAGVLLLTTTSDAARVYAASALGALVYTTINSAGYYAGRDEWPAVVMFAVLGVGAIAAGVVLLTA